MLKLEPAPKAGQVRYAWNDGTAAAQAEADRLTAEGHRAYLIGWQGRTETPGNRDKHQACRSTGSDRLTRAGPLRPGALIG